MPNTFVYSTLFLAEAVKHRMDAFNEVRVYLVDDEYEITQSTHTLGDIPSGSRIVYGVLPGYDTDGLEDRMRLLFTRFAGADDTAYPDVPGDTVGRAGTQLAVVLWSGDPDTSPRLGHHVLSHPYVLDGTPDDMSWPEGVADILLA